MSGVVSSPARTVRVSKAAEVLGVKRQTVDRWIGEGCPCDRGKSPRSPRLVNLDEVRSWAEAHGKETPWANGEGPSLYDVLEAPVDRAGYIDNLARRCAALVNRLDRAQTPDEMSKITASLARISQEMRQCVEAEHKREERERVLMRRDVAERLLAEVAGVIADEIRGVRTAGPAAVLDELARMGVDLPDREAVGRAMRVAFGKLADTQLERCAKAIEDRRGKLAQASGRAAA